MQKHSIFLIVCVLLVYATLSNIYADNLQPLCMKDAGLLPANCAEISFSFSHISGHFNHFEKQDSNRIRTETPAILFNISLGEQADIHMEFASLYQKDNNSAGEWGAGDLTVGTKIRLLQQKEQTTELAVLLTTKLPTADDSHGFGTDRIDFLVNLLCSQSLPFGVFYANIGLDILDDPRQGHQAQDDMVRYAAGLRVPIVSKRLYALLSSEGLTLGESINTRGSARAGFQLLSDTWTWHLGGSIGYTQFSEDWSICTGISRQYSFMRL
ncbi:MAG: transporter [Kiritimatiellae bacterium]|nr:transporter [Kiritimatiellia bacterium]